MNILDSPKVFKYLELYPPRYGPRRRVYLRLTEQMETDKERLAKYGMTEYAIQTYIEGKYTKKLMRYYRIKGYPIIFSKHMFLYKDRLFLIAMSILPLLFMVMGFFALSDPKYFMGLIAFEIWHLAQLIFLFLEFFRVFPRKPYITVSSAFLVSLNTMLMLYLVYAATGEIIAIVFGVFFIAVSLQRMFYLATYQLEMPDKPLEKRICMILHLSKRLITEYYSVYSAQDNVDKKILKEILRNLRKGLDYSAPSILHLAKSDKPIEQIASIVVKPLFRFKEL
ncbi:MAG: hypothetical protein ACTSYD_10010 [Candidatus Heimdallarchaeaceae archaeon]